MMIRIFGFFDGSALDTMDRHSSLFAVGGPFSGRNPNRHPRRLQSSHMPSDQVDQNATQTVGIDADTRSTLRIS